MFLNFYKNTKFARWDYFGLQPSPPLFALHVVALLIE